MFQEIESNTAHDKFCFRKAWDKDNVHPKSFNFNAVLPFLDAVYWGNKWHSVEYEIQGIVIEFY